MNTNYIYMLFYDIEMNTPEKLKEYRKFKKTLNKKGYSMLQESVYMKQVSEKTQAIKLANEISLSAPRNSNIRGLLLTQNNFDAMEILSGELEFSEQILKKESKIIEL